MIEIHNLTCPDDARRIARWVYEEWSRHDPAQSLESVTESMAQSVGASGIPCALTAHDGTKLAGTAGLVECDLQTRPQLGPWLANVWVLPEHRRQGIGRALILAAFARAKEYGYSRLFLYTHDQEEFYASLGCKLHEHTSWLGRNITILQKTL